MIDQWFVAKGKKKDGPFSLEQLKELASSWNLHPTDMVLHDGSGKWITASEVQGLFFLEAKVVVGSPSSKRAEQREPATAPLAKLKATWQGLAMPVKAAILGGSGLILFSCFCCCGIGLLMTIQEQSAARKNVQDGHELWAAGDKTKAVVIYKVAIDKHLHFISDSDKPTVFQRVIDVEAEQGNTSLAKMLIEKALDAKVSLSLSHPTAKQIMAQVHDEREAVRLAQEKAKADKDAERLAAEYAKSAKAKAAKVSNGPPGDGGSRSPVVQSVSRENYNRIKDGMTLKQVEAILGPGEEISSSGSAKSFVWQDSNFNTIAVLFFKGRVNSKSILSDK